MESKEAHLQEQQERFGEGDSYVIHDVLPTELAAEAYELVRTTVQWDQMLHKGGSVPRLIAVQGEQNVATLVKDVQTEQSQILYAPLYRHPADEQLACHAYSAIVARIAAVLNADPRLTAGGRTRLNHVLVQHYRDGRDLITEHADKTLDVFPGSVVVNLSLGATRHLTLRTKDKRAVTARGITQEQRLAQRVELPHNSVFVLGLETNRCWVHGIRPARVQCGESDGGRISLTFRAIHTYETTDGRFLFGGGADSTAPAVDAGSVILPNGAKYSLQPVIRNDEEAADRLYKAFSTENKSSKLTAPEIYRSGFNVI
ncbi:hypothetical protein D0Z00_002629 [Geotrichum galactomycetum]|uniref:Uncharacterized protein n=1 Tax=Geotrichum galactomycetum TaxID=27317 RepID=A0ACB6V3N1_9ASCO|nr:hypothetical protein D0Z00_002629 [Geotrichum candidum]